MVDHGDERVIDLDRLARPAGPPVHGAQWDEVRGVWERWDEAAQAWVVVGEGTVVPAPELDPALAVLVPLDSHSPTDDSPLAPHHVIDLDRAPQPAEGPPVEGAQWNELVGRWEVWSEPAGRWVAADRHAPSA